MVALSGEVGSGGVNAAAHYFCIGETDLAQETVLNTTQGSAFSQAEENPVSLHGNITTTVCTCCLSLHHLSLITSCHLCFLCLPLGTLTGVKNKTLGTNKQTNCWALHWVNSSCIIKTLTQIASQRNKMYASWFTNKDRTLSVSWVLLHN